MMSTSVQTAKIAFTGVEIDPAAASKQMVKLAEKARKDGLLALENDLVRARDEYTQKGLQLVVDGADSDLVRAILQSEIDGMAERHANNARFWSTAGGFAPTLGILGTVMSLVHVLEHLDQPGLLGHAISGAFIATLYGVGSANMHLPAALEQAQGALAVRGRVPDDAARGDPLDPGRRQPAAARREARDVHPAGRRREDGRGGEEGPRSRRSGTRGGGGMTVGSTELESGGAGLPAPGRE